MQILYVVGMMAVFVLCLALLSTARRILRSSPLESGQLALSSIQDFERSDDEGFIEVHTVNAISPIEDTEVQWGEDFEGFEAKAVEAETPAVARELPAQEAPVAAEEIALVPNAPIVAVAEEAVETGPAEAPRAVSFRKSSRRTYNYALECVLLGVSAWVLIQTQRSNMQHRQPHHSSDRVA
jgi:hypothetical protein